MRTNTSQGQHNSFKLCSPAEEATPETQLPQVSGCRALPPLRSYGGSPADPPSTSSEPTATGDYGCCSGTVKHHHNSSIPHRRVAAKNVREVHLIIFRPVSLGHGMRPVNLTSKHGYALAHRHLPAPTGVVNISTPQSHPNAHRRPRTCTNCRACGVLTV